jgi:hypothetical protein
MSQIFANSDWISTPDKSQQKQKERKRKTMLIPPPTNAFPKSSRAQFNNRMNGRFWL